MLALNVWQRQMARCWQSYTCVVFKNHSFVIASLWKRLPTWLYIPLGRYIAKLVLHFWAALLADSLKLERLSWLAPWNWTDLTHDPTNIGRRLESSWHNTLIAGASFVNWDVGAGEVVEWHSRGLPSEKWESLRMMTWKVFRIHAHGHGGVLGHMGLC